MGRSDDSISRRKSKKSRKKQEGNTVSNRIAAIIAGKKRRLTGKRRLCQGMCYSLPTPEDPFNDRHAKVDPLKKAKKTARPKPEKMANGNSNTMSKKRYCDSNHTEIDLRKQKKAKIRNMEKTNMPVTCLDSNGHRIVAKLGKGNLQMIARNEFNQSQQVSAFEDHPDCPSKFLILCLNTIQKVLQCDCPLTNDDKPFFIDSWGVEFWKSYSHGEDVIKTNRVDASVQQIAWIASTAADTISRKEKEGQSMPSPFLLYLVPTQEKASKVRKICKPLKARGIHTVSLHPGASIDHQIHGLKSCEPEFLVSTPERLLELVSSNAVDISGVSLLVIEGLNTMSEGGFADALLSIRQSSSGSLQTVIFGDYEPSSPFMQKVLQGSVCSLS